MDRVSPCWRIAGVPDAHAVQAPVSPDVQGPVSVQEPPVCVQTGMQRR